MQRIALLESEKHGGRTAGGSAASIALHVVVLAFAIAVTSHAGADIKRDSVIYVPLPRLQPEVHKTVLPATKLATAAAPKVPTISVSVPTIIPPSIPGPAIAPALPVTIATTAAGIAGAPSATDTAGAIVRGDAPFAAGEVDVAASVLPGQNAPVYPDALRMMGVEGSVVARFVIGRNGRVESDPTIVSATNDQFANAVKRYLATARYRPATKNGEPVRQLAEQNFEFAIRR